MSEDYFQSLAALSTYSDLVSNEHHESILQWKRERRKNISLHDCEDTFNYHLDSLIALGLTIFLRELK